MNNIVEEVNIEQIELIAQEKCDDNKKLEAAYKTGYINLLEFNAVIYDDKIKDKLQAREYDDYILSDDCIENFTILIEVNEKEKFLDSKAKSNVLEILDYMRNNMESKKEINGLIARLFSTKGDNSLLFYRNQYLTRNGMLYERTKNEYNPSIFEKDTVIKDLRYSLSLDYAIVMSLIDGLDEDLEEMIKLLPSQYFINTINVLMYECPVLLTIESFKERVENILNRISNEEVPNIEKTGKYRAKLLLKKLENKLA